MTVWKRHKRRKVRRGDPDFDKGVWVVEFTLRNRYVKQAVPEARNQREAEEAEIAMKRAIFDQRFNTGSRSTKLADFIDRVFVPHVRDNNRSHRDDEQRAEAIKGFFKGRLVRDIQPMDVERLKSHLRKRVTKFKRVMSPSTVNRYLFVGSKVFSLAVINGVAESNPFTRVEKLREPPPRERWLSGDEETALMEKLSAEGEYLTAFAELALHVGFRLGELLSRRGLHFDLNRKTVEIDETKTDQPRTVPLNSRAVEILTPLLAETGEDELLFEPSRVGRRRRQLLVLFSKAVSDAGIANFRYHDLRHTFATRLRAEGVHEYDIADLLGHSTTRMDTRGSAVTRGYAHGVPSRLREAVELLCTSSVAEFRRQAAG
jgi:integrase